MYMNVVQCMYYMQYLQLDVYILGIMLFADCAVQCADCAVSTLSSVHSLLYIHYIVCKVCRFLL